MPEKKDRYLPLPQRRTYRCFEEIIGCKWSAMVVAAIGTGVTRPGELERFIPGISKKVLSERLRKLVSFGVLTRTEQPGLPARVDYALTETGVRLAALLEQVRELNFSVGVGEP